MLFHDIFAHHPKEREAIIDQDRSVTYGEFQDLVERWAAYFEALGVKKGDRVGLVSKNCLEFIVTYFAVIKAGGVIVPINFQLVPREIEEVVSAYPGVAECSVIGIPDALRGQAICLYVVPREGETIDKKALRQYLIGRIAPYKVPREYFLVESLPKTALGKVRKNVLRDETVAILSKNKFAGRAL